MKPDLDAIGLVLLVSSYTAAALLVPDLSLKLAGEPVFGGVVGAAALLCLIVVLRAKGRRGTALERRCLALFLLLMPTVYLTSWLRAGGERSWLWIEMGGQILYGGLAFAGLLRSPWFLAAGIAAHGLLWDSWHLGRAPFIPDWYVLACVIIDVCFAAYVAAQVRAWRSPP
jgi:hypothetical protein